MILKKIPSSLSSIQDAIISTGQSSTVVTYNLVLDMLDNKAKTLSRPQPCPQVKLKNNTESNAASALLTYQCSDGKHNPAAKHSKVQCFAQASKEAQGIL
ncbi:hypothetical protein PTTG_09324 [Puccinia triticina 1-1 BBBD Race 1]|uniref:Uncharacterized protein n=1 Tax=Puccinia triticina (isolate 1-1 / race 1 (BBBD)) TaxID=630390 RepID=A0A180G3M1_PUCT1|nr:hypothetical protein PTTG_09324 [Puccinia triticina 1-1 BBBD Race 1]